MQLNQMKVKTNMRNKFFFALFAMGVAMTMAGSAAATIISAKIEKNRFKNTTPITGVRVGIPDNLENTFIVKLDMLGSIVNSYQKSMRIRAPGARTLDLKAAGSSKTYQAKISVTYVGGDFDGRYQPLLGIFDLKGCSNVGPSAGGYVKGEFMWKINDPDRPEACVAELKDADPESGQKLYDISFITMAFKVDASEFLTNAGPGTYTGSLRYDSTAFVGYEISGYEEGSDFNLDFEFEVISDLYVAPVETSVTLVPQGGWSRFTETLPSSLQYTLALDAKSSAPVSLSLRCQKTDSNNNCLISNRNESKITVPLKIELSSPSGSGKHHLIHNSKIDNLLFNKTPAYLQFNVDQRGIEQMAQHRGVPYSGNVTLIFDAN